MSAVRFERRDTTTAVTFAYDPVVVGVIKSVPPFLRSWNPARREWLILEPVYAAELARALRGAGYVVVGLDPPSDRAHGSDSAGWARSVFARVGPARAPLAYKLLSKLCHPDTPTGDHQLMQELNRAYVELPTSQKNGAA